MLYPINQSWQEQIELNWIGARVGLWDTALKFLSPGPRNDVTDHLAEIMLLILFLVPPFPGIQEKNTSNESHG